MIQLHHGDCFQIADDVIEDGSAALVFVDPPYNIGIFKKMEAGAYLEWCEQWIALCSRKLKPNGAFWVSHSKPDVLVDISRIIERYGRKRINWVTWDKYANAEDLQGFMDGYTVMGGLRSFQVMAEYLIYHVDEGQWTAQCDKERGFIFEPLRAYLNSEKERAGLTTRRVAEAFQRKTGSRTVTGMAGHWFTRIQWALPTEENYQWLRETLASHNHGGEYLRREYEDLRYTFNNPGKVSSVWQFPPAARNGHPTPKPIALLKRILEATSNEGDLVFDPMSGSGQTALACLETGRDCVAVEIEKKWYELGRRRVHTVQTEAKQLSFS